MKLMTKEKSDKKISDLLKSPEAQQIILTPDGTLHLLGTSPESSSIVHNYIIMYNAEIFAAFNGQTLIEKMDGNRILGIKTEGKLLLFNKGEEGATFISNNKKPDEGECFLMTVFTEKFIEFTFFNGGIFPSWCRLFVRPEKFNEIVAITLSLATSINSEVGIKLKRFILDGWDKFNG